MSKMSDLALSIEELACAGYDSAEIAEILNFPVEQVESFLEVISAELIEAQAMSDEQYAFECLYDWTAWRPLRNSGTNKTHANMGPPSVRQRDRIPEVASWKITGK